jgi:outer membrane protein assembly factor BamD (BamD/ComL family)
MTACASGPINIPDDLRPEDLVQRGQEASDRNRYNHALQYYAAIIDRFDSNLEMVCTAEYEIAFIHYKQKKYDAAQTEFNALLVRYDSPDEELLPQQFKKLAGIVLEQIGEKQKKKKKHVPPPSS